MKKLKDPEAPLERFFYQLPPGWKLDVSRLEHFLHELPRDARHVIEFRDSSWYDARVLDLLDRHRVALCLHDMRGSTTCRERVGRSSTFDSTEWPGHIPEVTRISACVPGRHGSRISGIRDVTSMPISTTTQPDTLRETG
jgi:hypothetical protein